MKENIWVPVKVMPGVSDKDAKSALDFFMEHWTQSGSNPFNGEYRLPETNDPQRLLSIDTDQISHCITNVDPATYDPQKHTVMVQCRFVGPHGAEALDKYIEKDIRFTARTVRVKDNRDGLLYDRIVTFDCVHNPDEDLVGQAKDIQAEKKDRAAFAAKQALKK